MTVSTHVLDATAGSPAVGVPVVLERKDEDAWHVVAHGVTDADGRITGLAGADHACTYRLTFDVDAYTDGAGFYPEVSVVFRITDARSHHHVPLLLSPFAYSTYRGS